MPISAYVSFPKDGLIASQLKQLINPFKPEEADAGHHQVDIRDVLIAEDIYAEVHPVSPQHAALWSAAAKQPILFEDATGETDYTEWLGKWNIAFLKWLKAASIKSGENVRIEYLHEQKGRLYERAWWESNPDADETECLGIESYDGLETLQWGEEAVRGKDGNCQLWEITSRSDEDAAPEAPSLPASPEELAAVYDNGKLNYRDALACSITMFLENRNEAFWQRLPTWARDGIVDMLAHYDNDGHLVNVGPEEPALQEEWLRGKAWLKEKGLL